MSDESWMEVGKKAPAFRLKDQSGDTVALKDFLGKIVVVYFYPKDNTPGCTQQACDFRDSQQRLLDQDIVVLGLSPDDQESHAGFSEKFDLNFPLLVDKDHKIAEKYGAWREKNLYGKKSMGIQRSTFLIDQNGKLAKLWKRVRVNGHVDQVFQAVDELE